ncbi:MAG: lipid-A-disaccharide synthase [Pirellulales bacterium]
MEIFFSVGEPSGDLHGANLIRQFHAIDGEIRCTGFGGPRMAEAGCDLQFDMTRLAVMWFARAVANLHHFLMALARADRTFRQHRPDAVVLIDFPGFNWWVARRAKRHGIPVFYYGPPQIWAWAPWRIHKMRRLVDHVLCKLPFEKLWYAEKGCTAVYVGHPYFDEVERTQLDQTFIESRADDTPLVTVLPGSRTQEVQLNLPSLLKAAGRIKARVPGTRFAVAAFRPQHAVMARRESESLGVPVDVFVGRTAELIEAADCCLAVSGSVSLELLSYAKPTVIVYQVSRVAFFAQRLFRTVKYITLVNLLGDEKLNPDDVELYDPRAEDADRVLMPEYLTCEDRSADMAQHVIEWLTDRQKLAAKVAQLTRLKEKIVRPGASQRAARYIVERLSQPSADGTLGGPHFAIAPQATKRRAS